jgi:hypothetical protein
MLPPGFPEKSKKLTRAMRKKIVNWKLHQDFLKKKDPVLEGAGIEYDDVVAYEGNSGWEVKYLKNFSPVASEVVVLSKFNEMGNLLVATGIRSLFFMGDGEIGRGTGEVTVPVPKDEMEVLWKQRWTRAMVAEEDEKGPDDGRPDPDTPLIGIEDPLENLRATMAKMLGIPEEDLKVIDMEDGVDGEFDDYV